MTSENNQKLAKLNKQFEAEMRKLLRTAIAIKKLKASQINDSRALYVGQNSDETHQIVIFNELNYN